MSKKQWGVLCTDEEGDMTVCEPSGGDGAIRPATKGECKEFIEDLSDFYPDREFKLFKFKIKEII